MNIEDDAMTPEERALERELAQRLARLGPPREPSPALDARILAAAHAAVQPRARARRRRAATWPAVFGIAASLAFALGVAWKLRPLPEPPVMTQESTAPDEPLADYAPPPPAQVYTPQPRRVLEVPAPPPAEAPARTRGPGSTIRRTTRKATPSEPPFVFEAAPAAPAAAPVPSSAPDAPTAGFAPPPPAPAATANAAATAQAAADMAPQHREATEATDASAAPAIQALRSQQARKAAAPMSAPPQEVESAAADEEVVPPATADNPLVRDAWLQRIRELAKAGRIEDARASLREFRHRYPGTSLPDDLRALSE